MPVLWINFRRSRWVRPLATLLVILLSGLVWQTHLWATSHSTTNLRTTELELAVISESLQSWSEDSAAAIPQAAVRNLNARLLYARRQQQCSDLLGGSQNLEHRPRRPG